MRTTEVTEQMQHHHWNFYVTWNKLESCLIRHDLHSGVYLGCHPGMREGKKGTQKICNRQLQQHILEQIVVLRVKAVKGFEWSKVFPNKWSTAAAGVLSKLCHYYVKICWLTQLTFLSAFKVNSHTGREMA